MVLPEFTRPVPDTVASSATQAPPRIERAGDARPSSVRGNEEVSGLAGTRRLRIAAVDDDTLIRAGLQVLLTGVDVVATYEDLPTLLHERPDVDVVLLDLALSGTGRPDVLQGAAGVRAATAAGFRVLIYTNERRREVLVGCLSCGAWGVVHKAEPLEAVVDAIARVASGEVVITPALVGLAELAERRDLLPSLSARQRQVLSARARGESFQSIGDRLFIAKKTAEEHWAIVAGKFADFLRDHSPADLERYLGLAAGDLLDWTKSHE